MKQIVIILLTTIMTTPSYSQKPDLESLKKLGRDSLIQRAVKKVNDPKFNPNHYDRIIVKASKTDLIVEFRLSIRISTKGACFYDAVYVALVG